MSTSQREKLILDHLPLVTMIAKTISKKVPSSVELEDLISAGTIGLIEAVDRYDSARANSLKTFAEFRIRGAIWDDLRGQDWTPRSVRTEQKAFKEIDESLYICVRANKKDECGDNLKMLHWNKWDNASELVCRIIYMFLNEIGYVLRTDYDCAGTCCIN